MAHIDINSAPLDDLTRIPGVSQECAEELISGRPYRSWDDIKRKAPGIPDRTVENLKRSNATISGR